MSDWPPPPRSNADLRRLIARAREADGSPPFSDSALVELVNGERELIWLEDAAALVSRDGTEAEFVVEPDARRHGLGTRMLDRLTTDSPGDVLFWAHGNHPAARALAASHGLEPVRELLHLTAAVVPGLRGDVVPFTPADADDWLALNARAFAGHPEQGGVTRAHLDSLMAEPWFDAQDLLLLHDNTRLIGYCWLKVEGELGEFYVVGVDPERQGEGLGRRLVQAGMARLAERGIRQTHLYVEGDNTAALRLYRSFGFRQDSIDVRYRWRA